MCGYISGLSILFQSFMYLSLYQNHTAWLLKLYIVSLKIEYYDSANVILHLKNCFGPSSSLAFPLNFRITLSISIKKNPAEILIGNSLSLQISLKNWQLYCMLSLQTWYVFFIYLGILWFLAVFYNFQHTDPRHVLLDL